MKHLIWPLLAALCACAPLEVQPVDDPDRDAPAVLPVIIDVIDDTCMGRCDKDGVPLPFQEGGS